MRRLFSTFATRTAELAGSFWAFAISSLLIGAWVATGPMFGWSDFHAFILNDVTTSITFLMVFLLQNSQSRDTAALQLKLDALIKVNDRLSNSLIDLERKSDEEQLALAREIREGE